MILQHHTHPDHSRHKSRPNPPPAHKVRPDNDQQTQAHKDNKHHAGYCGCDGVLREQTR